MYTYGRFLSSYAHMPAIEAKMTKKKPYIDMHILASSADLQPISNSLNDYCFSIMLDYGRSHLPSTMQSKSVLLLLMVYCRCWVAIHT